MNYKKIIILLLALTCILSFTACTKGSSALTDESLPSINQSDITDKEIDINKNVEDLPEDTKTYTEARIGAVGDILMHDSIIDAYKDDNYNFNSIFDNIKPIISSLDYTIANFEGNTAGDTFNYSGYPLFNCPDTIMEALHNSGFDMVLTANNHRLDMGPHGFHRTIQTAKEAKLDLIGSKSKLEDKTYKILDINGIKVGFTNYTYENQKISNTVNINGIKMPKELDNLMDTYNQNNLELEKIKLKQRLDTMRKDGAETIVFFPHWGEEYQSEPSSAQKALAQFLCDEKVDVIVGGHPHVLQPIDQITSSDGNHKTLIAYSLGNFISNQRLETIENIKGEWGTIFTFTLRKNLKDNSIEVASSNYIPTWVRKITKADSTLYEVVPTPSNNTETFTHNELDRLKKADLGITEVLSKYNSFSLKSSE